jgi:hypothetical protein
MLFYSPSGKGFLSGHADGAIVRYFFDDEGSGDTQVCLTRIYMFPSHNFVITLIAIYIVYDHNFQISILLLLKIP